MNTIIIKYNAGNVQSVMFALDRLGAPWCLTDDPDQIRAADRVIFPGVGEASTAMHYLRERGLDKLIPTLTQPVLGTCVGMQLMCRHSEENDTDCMGIFEVAVRRLPGSAGKVPHTGWNNLHSLTGSLTAGLPTDPYVYFVHSYAADVCPDTTAVCDYGHPFSAMLQRDNFYAAQFHTEISGKVGEQVLQNFLNL
jgi:imidazole glycerol-phosphate synthase subunit HisH